jgi:hypothetical protein
VRLTEPTYVAFCKAPPSVWLVPSLLHSPGLSLERLVSGVYSRNQCEEHTCVVVVDETCRKVDHCHHCRREQDSNADVDPVEGLGVGVEEVFHIITNWWDVLGFPFSWQWPN